MPLLAHFLCQDGDYPSQAGAHHVGIYETNTAYSPRPFSLPGWRLS